MIEDMKCRGFTIIELIVVITIMSILLVLGVVNLRGAQANGRDVERKQDIETIATHLEMFYTSGSDIIANGQYPSVDPSNSLIGHETSMLRDLDQQSLTAPDVTQGTDSLIAASDVNTQSPSIDQYIYQPIATDGSLCDNSATKECRKFNLYYRLEVDNTVQILTSKNQ
jgi:prepilin-type N-terminal cleavage/methylation domain-containing protein